MQGLQIKSHAKAPPCITTPPAQATVAFVTQTPHIKAMDFSIKNLEMKQETIKPPRGRFSNEAYTRLLGLYNSGIIKPNKALREELARELDKTPRSIQIWFQNKRAKVKKPTSSPDSTSSTPKRKPQSLTRLDMKLVEQQRESQSTAGISATVPLSATSTYLDAPSPLSSVPPTPIQNTPILPAIKLESLPEQPISITEQVASFSNFHLPFEKFPAYFEDQGPVTPVSPMSRHISQLRPDFPQMQYNIMSPISEVGFFSQEPIEPAQDLSKLTHLANGRRQLQINTLMDFGQPNEFLSPSSLLAPFQNANLNSPLDCGEASEALKDPQSFMRWCNAPL